MRKLFFVIICKTLFSFNATAQVWNLSAGSYEIFASYSAINYNSIYDSTGNITALDNYNISDQTIMLYGAYGLTDRLTLNLQVPYKMTSKFGENTTPVLSELNGLGNIEASVIYQYLKANPYLTASLHVEFNTSDYDFIKGLATGYNSWAIRPGLGYKSSYDKVWTSMYAGVEFRSNAFSNMFVANVESGYNATDFLFMAVNLFARSSFHNGTYCDCSLQENAMYPNDQTYFGAGLKTGFIYKHFGLHAAINIGFNAKNTPAAAAFTLGLSYKNN